jgi:hypothetical protein
MNDRPSIANDSPTGSSLDTRPDDAWVSQRNAENSSSAAQVEQNHVRRITDRDLQSAAYAQAVALRDSCIRRAMVNRVAKQAPATASQRAKL